jgi:hypothetical protein
MTTPRRRFLAVSLTASLPLVLAAALGAADSVEIQGSAAHQTIDCKATPRVVVSGKNNDVTLTGACEKLTLIGTGHSVHADGLREVELSGFNLRVEWVYALTGSEPKVTDGGMNNRVVKVAARTAPDQGGNPAGVGDDGQPLTAAGASAVVAGHADSVTYSSEVVGINGAGLRESYDCAGKSFAISGSGHDLTLRGSCDRVTVGGYGHRLRIENARVIDVGGSDHTVLWVGGPNGRPEILQHGGNLTIRQITADDFAKGEP